ncbi:hypothetical protein [Bradyrhizobium australafricanum]|uniref:hypothetical protein n=1 Tax=Bradyrhizobium australafricanum TaxID=2821406 RepID=UPI001CE2FFC7|nr:hypothetical protein [Bradyrhizobium australafricanum]MCA6103940.1 hypothetical protein [Bradyrhizobium australafricanum]
MSIETAALSDSPLECPVDSASTTLAASKPNFLASAYTNVGNGWVRAFPWTWSSTRGDCYSTVYVRPKGDGQQTVRVHVHKLYIRDATAAVFEITNQLHQDIQTKRSPRFRRRKRR